MLKNAAYDSIDLTLMAEVLAAHCDRHAIGDDSEREAVASSILQLYELGIRTHDGMLSALRDRDRPSSGTATTRTAA